jgi:hypothetical protein
MELVNVSPGILQLTLTGLIGAAWAAHVLTRHKPGAWPGRLLPAILATYSLLQIGFVVYLWVNHASFALNLEAMELTVLATVRRVLEGLPIYVQPSAAFTPLAYNPLYYILAIPFTWAFGPTLLALRLEAIAGMLGCGVVIFLAVRRETGTAWWGVLAVGLFAAAYRGMDTYLDNAHADSWMLFTGLLAVYLISLERSRAVTLLGVVIGVASFWFKQPGAAFAAGAVAYLTIRQGLRKAWPYWLTAAVLGPVLYGFVPARWAGPLLHEYTWSIPRQWLTFNTGTLRRLAAYYTRSFAFLAAASGIGWFVSLWRSRLRSIWFFLLPFAALTALSGAMDSESNNNVFIPLATWIILTGVISLHQATNNPSWVSTWKVPSLVVGASFVLLVYNPSTVIVSPNAGQAYADLQAYLRTLDGPVYAPWIGSLQNGFEFSPAVHWVPMTDLVRGAGKDLTNDPTIHSLLETVIHPAGRAYLLMNFPLEQDSALSFLSSDYILAADLGPRFAALSTLPKRYSLAWPRFVYVHREPSPG